MTKHLTLRINPGERVGIANDELPLLDENGSVIAACWQMGEDFDGENNDANMVGYAERIVACVNACTGISNEALSLGGPFAAARAVITQRDEAVSAIRELLAMLEGEAPLNTKRAYDVIADAP